MKKGTSATARVLAVLALIASFVIVIVLIAAAVGGGDEDGGGSGGKGGQVTRQQAQKPAKKTPATYEVEEGDTLTAIAHSTGVPVAEIEKLNPGIDPQILEPGEKLKLK